MLAPPCAGIRRRTPSRDNPALDHVVPQQVCTPDTREPATAPSGKPQNIGGGSAVTRGIPGGQPYRPQIMSTSCF